MFSMKLYQLSYQGKVKPHPNLWKFMFQKRKIKDNKIVCENIYEYVKFEPGTLGSAPRHSTNGAIRAGKNFVQIHGNLSFHRGKYRPTQPAFSSCGKNFRPWESYCPLKI